MSQINQNVQYRGLEYLHIYLWLLKDICWVTDWKILGTFMIIPTIGFAILITYLQRNRRGEVVHNFAVLSWISANSTWMIGEFFYNDTTRPIAIIFFCIGLLLLTSYYVALGLEHYLGISIIN